MKASVCIAVVALLALAAFVAAHETIPVQKRPRVPLTAEQEILVAAGHPVPLKGNIPQYGEYVFSIHYCHVFDFYNDFFELKRQTSEKEEGFESEVEISCLVRFFCFFELG
jgi:hypothetical protein